MDSVNLVPLAVGHMIGLGAIGSCLGGARPESQRSADGGLPPRARALRASGVRAR